MTSSRLNAAALAVAAALVLAQTRPVDTQGTTRTPVNVPGIDKPVVVVSGTIAGAETWSNSNYWVLRGAVFVDEGAELNIQAGTTVIGESGSVGTLIVRRGGRLNAIGTAAQPIVFTSDQPAGQRARRLGRHHPERARAGQPRRG